MYPAFPRTLKLTALASALSLTALLAACGGGGGGAPATGSTTTSSAAPAAPAAPATPSTAPSSPAAPASTPTPVAFPTEQVLQQQAYAEVLAMQKAVGITFIPGVTQDLNDPLNLAMDRHLNYMLTNKQFTSTENMSLPGATGANIGYLVLNAGYAGGRSLVNVTGMVYGTLPPGVTAKQWVDGLLSTGLGALSLLNTSEFGFGFKPFPDASNPKALAGLAVGGNWLNDYSLSTTGQQNFYTYPYAGQTNVPPTNLMPEFPASLHPFLSGTPLAPAGAHGTPITFLVGVNAFVGVQSATLTDPQGNSVPLQICSATIDPATGQPNGETMPGCKYGKAIIVPETPLKPNTQYTLNYTIVTGQIPDPAAQIQATSGTYGNTLTFTTGDQKPFSPSMPF